MKTQTYKIGTLIETKDGFKTVLGIAQFKDNFEYITASGNVTPKEVCAAYQRIDKAVEAPKAKKTRNNTAAAKAKKMVEEINKAKEQDVDSMADLSLQEPEVDADPFAE